MHFTTAALTAISLLSSFSLAQFVLTEPIPQTTVWVTVTNAAGVVQTVPSLYTQKFRSPAPMIQPKSGEIGLGQWGPGGGGAAAQVTPRDANEAHEHQHAKKTPLPTVDRHKKRCAHGHCH